MNKDLFDIPDDAPIDEEFIKEAKTALKTMTVDMIKNKVEEAKLFQESLADGGPGSANEALWILMNTYNIGIRYMAQKVGINRKKLVRMLEGELPIPPDTFEKIVDVIDLCQKNHKRK